VVVTDWQPHDVEGCRDDTVCVDSDDPLVEPRCDVCAYGCDKGACLDCRFESAVSTPCCDGEGHFWDTGRICDDWYEYQCGDACGSVIRRYRFQFCTGADAACLGETDGGSWIDVDVDTCDASTVCVDDGDPKTAPQCQPCDPHICYAGACALGFKQISAAGSLSCGLRHNGTVECVGHNSWGEADEPMSNEDFIRVTAGQRNACGVRGDGSVICWGANDAGQMEVPLPNSGFVDVDAGWEHVCAVKEGLAGGPIVCWGQGDGAVVPDDSNEGFVQVVAGYVHSCGRRQNGSVVCWGDTSRGQTDVGLAQDEQDFIHISAGRDHTCGLRTGGQIHCWGYNGFGQTTVPDVNEGFRDVAAGGHVTCVVGDDSVSCWGYSSAGLPQVSLPRGPFDDLAVGEDHACALLPDGVMTCSGVPFHGQALHGINASVAASRVSAGERHTCSVEDGQVRCSGADDFSQSEVPDELVGRTFIDIAAGSAHTCGIYGADATIGCWGGWPAWAVTAGATGFVSVATGGQYVCGLKASGEIVCWPEGGDTNVFDGTGPFTKIAVGLLDACALHHDGSILCTHGLEVSIPEAENNNLVDVAVGGYHICAVVDIGVGAGPILCWGYDTHGQMTVPDGASGFVAVAAGMEHTCGLSDDGAVLCWGQNGYGQTDVPPLGENSNFVAITAGLAHTCGLMSTGEVLCWGEKVPQPIPVP
jgi:alpha-tubulin suppressor-like RCC1 family protein